MSDATLSEADMASLLGTSTALLERAADLLREEQESYCEQWCLHPDHVEECDDRTRWLSEYESLCDRVAPTAPTASD